MTVQDTPSVVTEVPASSAPIAQPDRSVTPGPTLAARQEPITTDRPRTSSVGPGAAEMTRRVVVLVFGLIQIVIGLRVVLLLLDARTGNALVSGILNVSQVFVAPFNGILHTNALSSGGAVLDVSAVVAFIGWSILELIVVWAVGIFQREPAYTSV
jgi:hypothetical protein